MAVRDRVSSGRLRLTAPYCKHNRVLGLEVALDRLDDPLGGVVAGVVGGEIVEMLAVDEDHLDDS